MVCTHIYCFSSPKGKYLEPANSLHPIEAEGYEIRLDFISLVRELNFARGLDENPYKYLQDFEEICATLMISGMNHETLKWMSLPFSLMGWAKQWCISPSPCTHRIPMEQDHKPVCEHQRQLNNAMSEVVKKEVLKLLEGGVIYPIFDSEWVSPVQVVSKKGGMIVICNEKNELIPQRTVTGWQMCIDYRKINKATWKDHFPLPCIDVMLEMLAKHSFFCYLDGYSGYHQIPIHPDDQSKTTFTCPYVTFA
jgi:hypothetical protein